MGIPVVYGPHMYGQQSLEKLVSMSGAGKPIPAQELPSFITQYMSDPQISFQMQASAKNLFREMQLPLENTWKYLHPILQTSHK